MEGTARVTEAMLPGCELAKVPGRLGHDVVVEFECYTCQMSADGARGCEKEKDALIRPFGVSFIATSNC